MADVKFSELSTLTTTASADFIAIVDDSESASKQLSIDNLFGAVPVNLAVTDLTQSTSTSTGSITTTGGLGVVKDAFVGGGLDVDGTTNLDVVDIDGAVQLDGTLTIGVDDTGYDISIFGDTASSKLLWDTSDDQLEFGNAAMTISDARTSTTQSLTGLTIDMYNKLDTGSSNDRIGAAISTYGDTNAYTIRDSVGIRAMSRQSTGAEVTRLNTPLHSVLDLANTAIANNSGTTLSGAYGLVIDHDDTIATRTGQPTAFISFGEMYTGGTESIETKYLFDIFPNGKTGDATYATAANVAFYINGAQYATTKDVMILNSTDGAPASDAGYQLLMETDPYDSIQMEDNYMIETEDGEAILLETQENVGTAASILFETGSQDADGVLKLRVNGEDKFFNSIIWFLNNEIIV